LKKPIESIFAAIEIAVMPKPGECTESFEPRLAGVDFPGVDIEMDRTARLLDLLKSPSSEPPWEDAKIATTSNGYFEWAVGEDRDRVFRDGMPAGGNRVRIDR
jgi:hypothetical protein